MGAYKTFVSKYERGERQLDVIEFIALAEALELDPKVVIDQLMQAVEPLRLIDFRHESAKAAHPYC